MTIMEQMRGKQLPPYYATMYQDGFEPWEILQAAHTKFNKARRVRRPADINFNVEVSKK